MLSRVLEPEVMDSPTEAIDYDRMDHAAVNQAFVADLLAAAAETAGAEECTLDVLDIGTGTAQIPITVCQVAAATRMMAIDLAVAMLHVGHGNVEVAGLTDRIRLDRIDAKQMPYEDGRFAIVMSNSIVHHIPDPRKVFEAVRVLAFGGLIFVRDLLRPADDATVEHLVAAYAGGANDHQRQLFNQSLRAALSLEEARDLAAAAGLSRTNRWRGRTIAIGPLRRGPELEP